VSDYQRRCVHDEQVCSCDWSPPPRPPEEVTPIAELERREILKALRVTGGSVGKSAKLLGIGRATLYRRLGELDVLPGDRA
jgi:transcriptional regulator of acetoin/glycerol metabolism